MGCSKSEEPAAAAAPESTTGTETGSATPMPAQGAENDATVMAVQPDLTKLKAHANDHIKYPATRAEILAACAQTPEFSAGEKKWIGENLPEGTYNSSDDVIKALKLE
jgi:hypothetical protein